MLCVGCGPKPDRRQDTTLPPVNSQLNKLIDIAPVATPQVGTECKESIVSLTQVLEQIPQTVNAAPNSVGLRYIDDWLLALDNISNLFGLYEYVHPQADIRNQSAECVQRLNNLLSDFILSVPIHEALQKINLVDQDKQTTRYLDLLLREFKTSGANQDEDTRARIRALREAILKTGQEYARNIREDRLSLVSSVDELHGLPEDYINARVQPGSDVIMISTDYPDYQPIMQYAENDNLRLRMMKLFLTRARDTNTSVLLKLIKQRHQLAALLGYRNHAERSLEYEMVRQPEQAQAFIDEISQLAAARSQQDYAELLQAMRDISPQVQEVGSWQHHYLSNTVRRKKFNLDPKEVRVYFRYQRVKNGIFQLVEDLFGIQVRAVSAETWHKDVEVFDIYDDTKLLGRFYLDMHPRADKYQHAAHFGIRTGTSQRQLPMAVLVCNFPVDNNHKDGAFMEHRQVETFLHEFGHLLHSILGGHQQWSLLSGIATEHDFVEAPSQMLEEWIWDADSLATFARDDQGQPISKALVQKMNNARNFGRGLWVRNQMFYAALSLNYYTVDSSQLNLLDNMIELQNRYSPFKYVKGTYFYSSFGHLYGYGASYYTYMWSLVIALDMFAEFEKHGLRDTKLAMRYRREILEPGGTQDAKVLLRNFLGRDYNTDAFKRVLQNP